MKRNLRRSQRALPLIVFTVLFLAWLQPKSWAQEQSSSPQAGPSAAQAEHQASSKEAAGKESREEEKDETAQFKQSAAVKLVARITGLSLQSAYWVSVILNFAVIAGILLWFSRSRLPGMFRARTTSIQKAMQEARKASQEANQRLAEIEARLAKLDVEIAGMRATAEKEAAAEEARIKAAAEEDKRKIVGSAEQEIAAAAKQARRELTAYAADLSVSLAQKQIRVDQATDQALVRSFSGQLSASSAESKTGKDGH